MKFSRSRPLVHFHNKEAQFGFLDRIFVRNEGKEPDLNQRMFDEDFSLIFNYSNRRNEDLFDITTSDQDLTERLLGSVYTRYGPHGVEKTVREWTEEIAKALIWSGKAYYHLWDESDSDNIRISSFGPNGVSTLLGITFQWVPSYKELHWDRDDEEKPREVRLLDGQKVIRFKMPKALRQILRSQNRTLATIDRHQYEITGFHLRATHEDPNPTNHFDFRVWKDNQDRALYRATRLTGWNGRQYDGAKRSDFFDCHRLIRFRRNQLILRDDILKQLSSELTRVGRQFNAEYEVRIEADEKLPSVEQLNDLEVRLSIEETSFSEVIDFCYKA
nr:hypothetical protein [uncultured Cohaesibacter sp.]